MRRTLFGFLTLDKPAGMTSRDAVNRVQSLCRPVKVGHAGTLDPLATGVLVVGLGPATRLVEYVQGMAKHYSATFQLGLHSDTEDITGALVPLAAPPQPSREEIEAVLPEFLGTILQRPPAFSALKIGGQRSYDLARQGREVALAPRPVQIEEIRLRGYDYPMLALDVRCGSGTYIRALGRDLAERLGTAAVMSALIRTAVGTFRLDQSISPDDLTADNLPQRLLSPCLAVAEMPRASLREDEVLRAGQGGFLADRWRFSAEEVAAVDSTGQLVAILGPAGEGMLKPVRNFPAERATSPDAPQPGWPPADGGTVRG